MARALEIDVASLVDAMTRSPELEGGLNLTTGEIQLYPADQGWRDDVSEAEEAAGDSVDVPTVGAPELYRWMRDFAATVDENDVRQQLEDALDGRGAFGRFRRAIERYPDIVAEWNRNQTDRVLAEARPWLESLDVAPVFRFPPAAAAPPRPSSAQQARVGLVDLLVLGAPDGKTELLDGRVYRVVVAGSAAEARAVFKAVARELCEMHGIAWRKRFIEGERYEVGRFVMTVEGARVELAVAVSPALWRTFAG